MSVFDWMLLITRTNQSSSKILDFSVRKVDTYKQAYETGNIFMHGEMTTPTTETSCHVVFWHNVAVTRS
mgnify:CR=1 FL=1